MGPLTARPEWRLAHRAGLLLIRGVVRPASKTMDRDVMYLVVLAVHQEGVTVAADKINGVIARIEDRRHVDSATDERWDDQFERATASDGSNVRFRTERSQNEGAFRHHVSVCRQP